jgi:uncharacterized lipoprotein YddW (UPF0748 family)
VFVAPVPYPCFNAAFRAANIHNIYFCAKNLCRLSPFCAHGNGYLRRIMKKYSLLLLCCGLCNVVVWAQQPEFRAAWVATVENIDWPSKRGLSVEQQKAEFITLVNLHKANGLNALIVQVRPAADAFYPSQLEPWSEYLTGRQGQAPVPFYDPLEFMIAETHRRGMEFHAWLNPYRAVFNTARSSVAPNHPTRLYKTWFVQYGDASRTTTYFDPGNPDARRFVTSVIKDLVERYDLDGVHFDDYFYPYLIPYKAGSGLPYKPIVINGDTWFDFPDASSYARYGGGLSKPDWRRSNTDSIILMLSNAIKTAKPWVKFGISPFGVWRNAAQDSMGSNTRAGQTNYDHLFADILLWLRNGWIDYVVPQLYWEIGHERADYTTLVNWWSQHSYGRHCYIGLAPYRAGSNAAWKERSQLPRQIALSRSLPNIQGQVYFSSKSFVGNPNGWNDSLRNNQYKTPVPTPTMPWLAKKPLQ